MIKYFHELTKEEFKDLFKWRESIPFEEIDWKYPQPPWCDYAGATHGILGCWSLTDFRVTREDYCKDCDCYIKKEKI